MIDQKSWVSGEGGEKFMPAEILAKFQFDWCILWQRSEDPLQNAQQQNLVLPQSCMERLKD